MSRYISSNWRYLLRAAGERDGKDPHSRSRAPLRRHQDDCQCPWKWKCTSQVMLDSNSICKNEIESHSFLSHDLQELGTRTVDQTGRDFFRSSGSETRGYVVPNEATKGARVLHDTGPCRSSLPVSVITVMIKFVECSFKVSGTDFHTQTCEKKLSVWKNEDVDSNNYLHGPVRDHEANDNTCARPNVERWTLDYRLERVDIPRTVNYIDNEHWRIHGKKESLLTVQHHTGNLQLHDSFNVQSNDNWLPSNDHLLVGKKKNGTH